jgi:uncharacterized membrane protein (DUF4010 family)
VIGVPPVTDLELWQALGVALAVGLLVGAERERSKAGSGSAGIRTFALASLLGALTAVVPVAAGVAMATGLVLLTVVGYVASGERDPGVTSEVALLVTLGLGALTPGRPAHAVAGAVVLTVLLASKDSLHHFVRQTVTDRERTDALKFFVAAFVVLPLLPTGHVGPYGVWVPQRVWLLVVLITGIGWVGYAATRALGARRGLLVTGLAGGFVSGTATTGTLAARTRTGTPAPLALAGAAMASVATLVQLIVLTALVSADLSVRLLPGASAGAAVLLAEAWVLSRRAAGEPGPEQPAEAGRPFALAPALVLAAVISLVLLLATWLTETRGAAGSVLAAAAGSLADVHAAALAMATLVDRGSLDVPSATLAIAAGLATNTCSKLVASLVAGPRFTATLLLLFLPVGAALALTLLLT